MKKNSRGAQRSIEKYIKLQTPVICMLLYSSSCSNRFLNIIFCHFFVIFRLVLFSLYPNWVQPGEWKYIFYGFFFYFNILCACVHDCIVHIVDGDNVQKVCKLEHFYREKLSGYKMRWWWIQEEIFLSNSNEGDESIKVEMCCRRGT